MVLGFVKLAGGRAQAGKSQQTEFEVPRPRDPQAPLGASFAAAHTDCRVCWPTQIAQLAHAETADVARTRFCDGGMLTERASIRTNLLDRWHKQNWLIKDAVDSLWKG